MRRMPIRTMVVRWGGVIGVGVRRLLVRMTQTARQRTRFSILGVAVAIVLLLLVTGIGLGLATGTTVSDADVDYWITPETDGYESPLVATDAPQFGSVHPSAESMRTTDGVESASPVLSQVLRVEASGAAEYVLVIGVINDGSIGHLGGVNVSGLTPHDPYYNEGAYDGEWTGEVALSPSVAATLAVGEGDALTIAGNESFAVTTVDDEATDATGGMPTAVVQLSELQTLTGADAHDQADQFVVGTTDPGVRDALEAVYPSSTVNSRAELTMRQTLDSELPLALAVTAFVVALAVGTLFVITTMGLELVADRQQVATMAAIGVSGRSQLGIIAVQLLATTTVGGVLGSLGGLAGLRLVNTLAVRLVTTEPIAVSHPGFVLYGVAVAVAIGWCSLPILLVLARHLTGGVPQ